MATSRHVKRAGTGGGWQRRCRVGSNGSGLITATDADERNSGCARDPECERPCPELHDHDATSVGLGGPRMGVSRVSTPRERIAVIAGVDSGGGIPPD